MEGTPTPEELIRKLEQIVQRQQQFQQEINDLQLALYNLKRKETSVVNPPPAPEVKVRPAPPVTPPPAIIPLAPEKPPVVRVKKEKTPLEEFIGTNLLNKIGIAVLVIGVGIGAEYAIDHDLISPLTRIVLGYFCGLALIGIAIRLKAKYQNFSAVLLSGGMAVLYFITFAAYDLYALFPQAIAFVLMVLFTAFTVFAALQYNLQAVAVIGLVGAYAVPFLLSDGSGKVVVLFSYMTIINTGILLLAFKKAWRHLYYLAFVLTWLAFSAWFFEKFNAEDNLWIELGFSTVFFITFYATVLSYKLVRKEGLSRWDVVVVLLNSSIYFGLGYFSIETYPDGAVYLGLFTLFNAIMHFVACFIIFKRKEQSRDIFYFAAGLVLVFLTLAVPVQLEGHWVTIVWASEAALLFWLGRTKNFAVYEKLSYPLIILAFASLLQDWDDFYGNYYLAIPSGYIRPFLNVQLLSSLLVCAAFGLIVKINLNQKFSSPLKPGWNKLLGWGVPALLLITLYFSFYLEVENLWQQRFVDSQIIIRTGDNTFYHSDYDLLRFKNLWLLNYSAIFILVLALVNIRWPQDKIFSYILVGAGTMVVFSFITTGLVSAGDLRTSYLNQTNSQFYFRGAGHLLIRYVSIGFAIALLAMNYFYTRKTIFTDILRKSERVFFHVAILAILSSELVSGLALLGILDSDKLALSILWGVYALTLIVYGLMRDLKYIRITAITLFGVTLIKLFFYDMADMGTIAKTIVMIVLGALLLVASFLYNKFKKPVYENS